MIKKLGLCGLMLITLLGCGDVESPKKFRADGTFGIMEVTNRHNGVKKEDNDRDFDGDGINDFYIETNDGTIFATHSTEYPPKTRRELFSPTFHKYEGGRK